MQQPTLITGQPRSGTTWIGQILSTAPNTNYLFEPDNEKNNPFAWFYKRNLHRFPYLTALDKSSDFERLWGGLFKNVFSDNYWIEDLALKWYFRKKRKALEAYIGEKTGYIYINNSFNKVADKGKIKPFRIEDHLILKRFIKWRFDGKIRKRPLGGNLLIKSVHTPLCLDWLNSNFNINILVILRNPYSLYASYKRIRMPDGFRNLLYQQALQQDFGTFLTHNTNHSYNESEQRAVQICLIYKVLETQLKQNPSWFTASHDRMCIDPELHYRRIFEYLGYEWNDNVTAKIQKLNRIGNGFNPSRISNIQPTKWRKELSSNEVAIINKWIGIFQLNDFFETYVY